MTFQQLILALQDYWGRQGCAILQPYDTEMGAGTFHWATFLRCLGPQPWRAAYVQPCRRPADARYAENPFRLGHYYQFQVVMKPSPHDIQSLYLGSLEAMGIDLSKHDVRFVEDDWESPTLGAWGLGWEVWLDGMEITQYTYFQQCAGFELAPITVELTYGLERLAMYLQKVDHFLDLTGSRASRTATCTSGMKWSSRSSTSSSRGPSSCSSGSSSTPRNRGGSAARAFRSLRYDYCMKCSHTFNLLDARGAISVAERAQYIKRVRDLALLCAQTWVGEPAP